MLRLEQLHGRDLVKRCYQIVGVIPVQSDPVTNGDARAV